MTVQQRETANAYPPLASPFLPLNLLFTPDPEPAERTLKPFNIRDARWRCCDQATWHISITVETSKAPEPECSDPCRDAERGNGLYSQVTGTFEVLP